MAVNTQSRNESPWVHLDGAAHILQVSRRTMERIVADPEERERYGAQLVRGQWRFPKSKLLPDSP